MFRTSTSLDEQFELLDSSTPILLRYCHARFVHMPAPNKWKVIFLPSFLYTEWLQLQLDTMP